MLSVSRTTTLILATLASAALADSATIKDISFTMEKDTGTICDHFKLSGTFSNVADTDRFYYGLAYSTTVDGEYKVLTDGVGQKHSNGDDYVDSSFLSLTKLYSNVTIPKDDVYEFGFYARNFPVGVESTLSDGKLKSYGTSTDITSGDVFLSIPGFPPSSSDVAAGKMYKASEACDTEGGSSATGATMISAS